MFFFSRAPAYYVALLAKPRGAPARAPRSSRASRCRSPTTARPPTGRATARPARRTRAVPSRSCVKKPKGAFALAASFPRNPGVGNEASRAAAATRVMSARRTHMRVSVLSVSCVCPSRKHSTLSTVSRGSRVSRDASRKPPSAPPLGSSKKNAWSAANDVAARQPPSAPRSRSRRRDPRNTKKRRGVSGVTSAGSERLSRAEGRARRTNASDARYASRDASSSAPAAARQMCAAAGAALRRRRRRGRARD